MPRQAGSVKPLASVSLKYRAPRALGSAVRVVRLGLFALSTNNAEPSPPPACRQTASSAGVQELVAPMPTSSTKDYQESSFVATSGLHIENIRYNKSVIEINKKGNLPEKIIFPSDILIDKTHMKLLFTIALCLGNIFVSDARTTFHMSPL